MGPVSGPGARASPTANARCAAPAYAACSAHTIVSTPPPAKRTNPALAVAIIAGLAIVMGAVFFVTRDDGKSGGGPFGGGGQSQVEAQPTKAPGSATPGASPVPSANDGPVIAPGYKMTAIFVPPQGSNATPDVRIYDAIVQGVDWNDSAKVYGRRYPLQYVFNNATTNLLLKPPNVDQAKRLLTAAGFSATAKPKILLTFNPSDRPFASWLSNQMQSLGYNVITDANSFTAEEKAKGYHGLIIAILPA